jgi:hypothetical protein
MSPIVREHWTLELWDIEECELYDNQLSNGQEWFLKKRNKIGWIKEVKWKNDEGISQCFVLYLASLIGPSKKDNVIFYYSPNKSIFYQYGIMKCFPLAPNTQYKSKLMCKGYETNGGVILGKSWMHIFPWLIAWVIFSFITLFITIFGLGFYKTFGT